MKKELNSAPIMAREQWTPTFGQMFLLLGQVLPVCVCKMDTLNFINRQLTGKPMKNKVIRLMGGGYPSWLLRLFCYLNKVKIRFLYPLVCRYETKALRNKTNGAEPHPNGNNAMMYKNLISTLFKKQNLSREFN